jgi:phosphoglucosamine mutase
MGKYFGTDGIRGIAGTELSLDLAYRIGLSAAKVLGESERHDPKIVVGKDTRLSGDAIEAALCAGLLGGGADVIQLGVVPTPAVAFVTTSVKADAGIVISASHNTFEYNGIKIFNGSGFKLSDTLERQIENLLDSGFTDTADGAKLGCVLRGAELNITEYIQHLRNAASISRRYKVGVDCSNGAAYATAERLFGTYCSELQIIGDEPDGFNINDCCGSTAPEKLAALVVKEGLDCGFAFDGDADRCIAVDERGTIVDGDKIMAVIAEYMQSSGELTGGTLVATVLSNIGLHEFAKTRGMNLLAADVGDRHVLELMQKVGAVLGGEQSGHIICFNEATTGDGQLAAMKVLSAMSASGKTLSELASAVKYYPQTMVNKVVADKDAALASTALKAAIETAEKELSGLGRVLVRASGTEPKIRVFVEAPVQEQAERLANEIAKAV